MLRRPKQRKTKQAPCIQGKRGRRACHSSCGPPEVLPEVRSLSPKLGEPSAQLSGRKRASLRGIILRLLELLSVGRVRSQLSGLIRFWSFALHGVAGLPTSLVRLPGRGCGPLCSGDPSSLQERMEAGSLRSPSLILPDAEAGQRRRAPAPVYRPGQTVWLPTKGLPLQVASRKLAPGYLRPFEVDQMISI